MGTAVGKTVPDSLPQPGLEKRRVDGQVDQPPTSARREDTVSECVQVLTDPGIPTLSEVLDSAALAKHLRGVSLGLWNAAAIEEIEVRVLRHHAGHRCTLEIGLRTEKGGHFLIG